MLQEIFPWLGRPGQKGQSSFPFRLGALGGGGWEQISASLLDRSLVLLVLAAGLEAALHTP